MQADVYTDQSGGCAAFLANIDSEKDKVVTFRNKQYDLPAWSVSILPDCKNVVFNTAKVFDYPFFMVFRTKTHSALSLKLITSSQENETGNNRRTEQERSI